MRRALLLAVAFIIPLTWAVVPYGEHVGSAEPETFASVTAELVREVLVHFRGLQPEQAIFPIVFLGLIAPLYPAVLAALLIITPRWLGSRRRWTWIVQGVVVLVVSAVGWLWAVFALSVIGFGTPAGPKTYLPFWLLPGFAAVAGLAALSFGVAPRSRLARWVLNG